MFTSNRLLQPAQLLLSIGIFILVGAVADPVVRPRYPEGDMGKDSLPARKHAQIDAAKQWKVFSTILIVAVVLAHLAAGAAEKHHSLHQRD